MKNFRKLFAVVLAVAMLAAQIVVPTNAATNYCSECGNSGVLGDLLHKIDATCKDGFEIHECKREILDKDNKPTGEYCTGTITIRIKSTSAAHTADGVTVPAVAHTCTEDGNFEYQTCKVCEAAYLVNGTWVDSYVDKAPGHDYKGVVTDPDCTNGGFTTYTCSVCQDTYEDDKVPCTGHKFDKKIDAKAATCKEAGWEEYYVCSNTGCEEIDPERPFVELPIEDHGLRVVGTKANTCSEDGYNIFQCNEPSCPYSKSVTEVLKATGHNLKSVNKKNPTCTEKGVDKHKECKTCGNWFYWSANSTPANNINTKPASSPAVFDIAPLGHNEVLEGYRAPTCTEKGLSDAIVCDRCDLVHHAGEEIAALGHDLVTVAAKEAECLENGKTVNGNIEHKKCKTCGNLYAKDVENDDIDAVALKAADVVTTIEHQLEEMTIDSTCVEQGYTVYTCKVCHYTYSKKIDPKGHDFEGVEEVPAECEKAGVKAHNKCTVCGDKFAVDADEKDYTIVALTDAELAIKALEHEYEKTEFVKPTYTQDGITEGELCKLCGAANPANPAVKLPKLQQAVKFYYELAGVKGAADAVNSGYITLNVYFDVLEDTVNDKAEYESDVLAEIYGIDFSISYNKDVFELTHVNDVVSPFGNFAATPLVTAKETGKISVSQDTAGNIDGKAFRGTRNLLTTLTFQVNDDQLIAGEYDFTADWNVINPDDDVVNGVYNVDYSTSETTDKITVKMLGDANGSGSYSAADTLLISQFIKSNVEGDLYKAEYDMNKDGVINGKDLNLIRRAAVSDEAYKEVRVDPNEVITPEV